MSRNIIHLERLRIRKERRGGVYGEDNFNDGGERLAKP